MKISIITVCYNSEATIEAALKSVLDQTYSDIEYIVIDGGSTDQTLPILEKYREQIAQLVSEPDNGIYYALNKGISMASGELIGILHSDDFYSSPDILSHVQAALEKNNAEGVYGDLQYVERDKPEKVFRNWVSGPYREGLFLRGWMPPHPTFFVKKDSYMRFGLFNTDFKTAADYELMLRFIHKHKIKLAYLPEVIVKMRVGGKSNDSFLARIKANIEDRKAWRVNDLRPGIFTLLIKPLSKLRQFYT
jgi:glycosyltransferase involved in cell wall biosynthesis